MTLIGLIEQLGLPALVLLAVALCAAKHWMRTAERMAIDRAALFNSPPVQFQWDGEEKPKRKRYSPAEAYEQRLQEIDEEADYQRDLAYQDYLDALKSAALPVIVVSGSAVELYEDDSDFLIYKDER